MSIKSTIHFDPVFEHWRKFATLKVWEIASMMSGYEPRTLGDVVVRSSDPLDFHGSPLDCSDEERRLTTAVLAGVLDASSSLPNPPNGDTEIIVASLIPWLRGLGVYDDLANGLTPSGQDTAGHLRWTIEFTNSVSTYREKFGTKAAAAKFGISEARIRKKLPSVDASRKGYSAFNQGG